jgi:hypothetical protein
VVANSSAAARRKQMGVGTFSAGEKNVIKWQNI